MRLHLLYPLWLSVNQLINNNEYVQLFSFQNQRQIECIINNYIAVKCISYLVLIASCLINYLCKNDWQTLLNRIIGKTPLWIRKEIQRGKKQFR